MWRQAIVSAVLAGAAFAAGANDQQELSETQLLERLAADPQDAAARYALAEIYFRDHRDAAAEFAARQAIASGARAGDEDVVEAARAILEALERRRRWVFTADATLAPDTTREFIIPGETEDDPTTLREVSSGIGADGFASLEFRTPMAENGLLSIQGVLRGAVYEDDDFNIIDATLLAGPAFLLGGDDVLRTRALVQTRSFGGEAEFTAYGAEASLARSFGARYRGFGRLTVRDVDYDTFDAADALTVSFDADVTRYGDGGGLERGFGLLFRNDAEGEAQSFWFARLGAGAYREFPGAIGVYVQPSASIQSFDGLDPVALEDREDTALSGLVRVSKRDWRIFSAAPFLSLEATQTVSTIDRFEGTETALRAGFTRSF